MSTDIDWRKFADINGLTIKQFEEEILMTALTIGVMMIDKNDGASDNLIFTTNDDKSDIELTVRRK